MTEPHRRDLPRRHLDAATASVERALLARAKALDEAAPEVPPGTDDADPRVVSNVCLAFTAAAFRSLAEELHYW